MKQEIENALFKAIEKMDLAGVRAALDGGANSSQFTYVNDTPLTLAIASRYRNVVLLLLEHGADPNVFTSDGVPPLITAIIFQDQQIIADVLEYGAKLDGLDDGSTMLGFATSAESRGLVERLLEIGANPNLEDSYGNLPLNYAIEAGQKCDVALVETLLRYGADVNKPCSKGVLPLEKAVFANKISIVELFLDFGADPNRIGRCGLTPHQVAAMCENKEAQELLLAASRSRPAA